MIGTNAVVDWQCGSRVRCVAADANISRLEEHAHRSRCRGKDVFTEGLCQVFVEAQSINVIVMDGCEEQFLVDNIRKDLSSSTILRIIKTSHDNFSVEALSHILKNSELATKTIDMVDFNQYAKCIHGNASSTK
jgi:hypothetical protein